MKFSTIASLLTTAASVTMAQPVDESAAATPSNADSSLPFGLMSLRSATAIHFASTSAAQGNLWLNLPNQDAKCHPAGQDNDGWAVFYLKNDRLYLYNGGKQETQRFYTDRSSKGASLIFITRFVHRYIPSVVKREKIVADLLCL